MKKGWESKRLGDVVVPTETAAPQKQPNTAFEYIDVSSISNTAFEVTETQRLVGKDAPSRARRRVRTDDILFATIRPTLKRIAAISPALDNAICSTGFIVLRASVDLLPRLLFYYLQTDAFASSMERLQKGASYPAVTDNDVRGQLIPLPPLDEQRRIVAILDEAFDVIAAAKANAEQTLRNAHEVFESYRDATFSSLQQDASLKPLEGLVDDIATGPFGSLLHKSDYEEGGIPLVNPINIEDDAIIPDERKAVSVATAKRLSRYRLKAGDIAVGRRGDIGRCAVVAPEQDGWLCGTGCFVIRAGRGVAPDFLAHLLRSRPYRMQLVAKAGRATMPSISNKDLAELQVPALSSERQKKALEGFAELSAYSSQVAEVAGRKLAALDELKASLLHQAFTGAL